MVNKFHAWLDTQKGEINENILTKVFRTFDHLDVFKNEREQVMTPFILVDGHQYIFSADFMRYTIEPSHTWGCCIGVPYLNIYL